MKEGPQKDDLRLAIIEKVSALATAGFGLVAALAWNDAVQSLFRQLFGQQAGITAKFIYAVIVTVIIVLVTVQLGRTINKLKKRIEARTGTPPGESEHH